MFEEHGRGLEGPGEEQRAQEIGLEAQPENMSLAWPAGPEMALEGPGRVWRVRGSIKEY